MTFLPCKACGQTMTGIVDYLIRGKMRFLCHDCKMALNEYSQQIKLSLSDKAKFKELLRIEKIGK
jgi:hypothetical protein